MIKKNLKNYARKKAAMWYILHRAIKRMTVDSSSETAQTKYTEI